MKKKWKKKVHSMNIGKGRDKSTRKKTLLLKSNDKELLTPLRKIIVLLVKDEDTHKTLQSYKFICFEINTNTSLRNFS